MLHTVQEFVSNFKQLSPHLRLEVLDALQTVSLQDPYALSREVHRLVGFFVKKNSLPPFPILAKQSCFGKYLDGVKVLERFMADHLPTIKGGKRTRTLVFFLHLVAQDLQEKGIPFGPSTLGQGLQRIYQIVEQAFPRYIETGTLTMICCR